MSDCCDATARHFGKDLVERELRLMEEKGPGRTTSELVELLEEAGVEDATVLDVGSGLGAASGALLDAGARRATLLDASEAYVEAARDRARDRGIGERVDYRVGDFVSLAPDLDTAGVVVLDRVVCCDPRMEAVLEAAAGRARRLLGLTYPRDRLSVRTVIGLQNLGRRLRGDEFRVRVHPVEAIREILEQEGLRLRSLRRTFVWEIVLYQRDRAPAPAARPRRSS